MRIVYVGRDRSARSKWGDQGTVLLLHFDNWDDYGQKTRFPTTLLHNGEEVEISAVRILFEGEQRSHAKLASLLEAGWTGEFPITSLNYVSVPEEITFYEQLASILSPDELLDAATALRDASYLSYFREDEEAQRLIASSAFEVSLQRERGSQKAFTDGWRLLAGYDVRVRNFSFQFRDVFGALATLDFRYETTSTLPRDINVVIGANGTGKTSLLRQLVHAWLEPNEAHDALKGARFSEKPNLSQLVAVSYSPFERLPVDVREQALDHPLKDQDVYAFFGFRGREGALAGSAATKIRNSVSVPKANSARSLLRCLADDRRYRSMKSWSNKLTTLKDVLGSAMTFDFPALRLRRNAPGEVLIIDHPFNGTEIIEVEQEGEVQRYLPITSSVLDDVDLAALNKHVDSDDGVTFFHGEKPIFLSSGQRLFFYIVVNVLGAIRRNSLILIDEPELFLHPTLEVQYVDMLKRVLDVYASKALIATHSLLVVREVPTSCVHILERAEGELVVKRPPFETFGGDVQRISSYVFGDKAVTKPFEDWLRSMLKEHGSAEAVLTALGEDVNEELIIQIHAMENSGW